MANDSIAVKVENHGSIEAGELPRKVLQHVGFFFSRLTLLDHEGAKKPEKAPMKESVQGSSSSSNKDKQPQKSPAQRPLKEDEEVVKGSSKAVSYRERRYKSKWFRY